KRRRHTRFSRDWSSDVCSSDLKQISKMPLVAHNSVFDEGCLTAVLSAYQLPAHQNPFFCTYRKSKSIFPNLPNHKLTTVSEYLRSEEHTSELQSRENLVCRLLL